MVSLIMLKLLRNLYSYFHSLLNIEVFEDAFTAVQNLYVWFTDVFLFSVLVILFMPNFGQAVVHVWNSLLIDKKICNRLLLPKLF